MMEINTALASARLLLGLAKAGLDARDDAKVKAALADLQEKLYDATSAALSMAEKAAALQTALSDLQREKADLQAKALDRGKYRLEQLRPGAFALASKPADEGGEAPAHYLCQACDGEGFKAILQASPDGSLLRCPREPQHSIKLRAAHVDVGRLY
jgi:hypothetical protein